MSGNKLSVSALWILDYLRANPGATLQQISDASPVNEEKTEELHLEAAERGWPTHRRDGSVVNRTVRAVEYPTAQRLVRRLLDRDLVLRDPATIGRGESYRHFVVERPKPPKDPLERAFTSPAVPGRPRLK